LKKQSLFISVCASFLFLGVLTFSTCAHAAMDVTLQWTKNSEPDLAGYDLYYDTDNLEDWNPASHDYPSKVEYSTDGGNTWTAVNLVGSPPIRVNDPDATMARFVGLDDAKRFYFAIRAFDGPKVGLNTVVSGPGDFSDIVEANPPPRLIGFYVNGATGTDQVYTNSMSREVTVRLVAADDTQVVEYLVLDGDADPTHGTFQVLPGGAQQNPDFTVTFGPLDDADGNRTLRAWVKDNEGVQNQTAALKTNVYLDRVKPSSAIVAPADGVNLKAILSISGTSSDGPGAGVQTVEIQVTDGTNYLKADGTFGTTANWFPPGGGTVTNWSHNVSAVSFVTDTTYTIRSRATDKAGNVETLASPTAFMYDDTPPESAVLITFAHYNGANWSPANSITGSALDTGSGVSQVHVRIRRTDTGSYWTGSDWTGDGTSWLLASGTTGWTYSLPVTNLSDGVDYSVESRAMDNAGNLETTPGSDTFRYDATLPTSGVAIARDYYRAANWIQATSISGTAQDPGTVVSGLAMVELRIQRDSDGSYWTGSVWGGASDSWLTANGTSNWTYSLGAGNLTDGVNYTVQSRATDNAGNVQTPLGSDTFRYDVTLPDSAVSIARDHYNVDNWIQASSISGTAQDPGTVVSGLATVDVRIQRDSDGSYWTGSAWGGGSDSWLTAIGTSNWTYSLAATNLTDGVNYTVDSRALDNAGNVQPSPTTDTFRYDVTVPDSAVSIARDHYNAANWIEAASISGTALDPGTVVSGLATIEVRIRRDSDGSYWTGSAWGGAGDSWLTASGTSDWTYTLGAGSLTDGVHYTVGSRATDNAGNVQTALGSDTFRYDVIVPESVVSIARDHYNAGNWIEAASISGTAQDPGTVVSGLATVEVRIRRDSDNSYWTGSAWGGAGDSWLTANGTSDWTYFLGVANLNDGVNYTVQSRALDNAGNVQTALGSDTFRYDVTLPDSTVSITRDHYNAANWLEASSISGTAQDPGTVVSGLAKVEVRIRRDSDWSYWTGSAWGGAGDSWLTASGTSDWTYALAATNLTDGVNYTVESRALDNAGNVQPSPATDTFRYDVTVPESAVSITRDHYNAVNWLEASSISGTAQDPGTVVSGLAKVEVRIRRDSDGSYWTGSAWGGAGDSWLTASGTSDWTYALAATNLTDGVNYTVESRALDNAGNVQPSPATDTFRYDVTVPESAVSITRDHYNAVNWLEASSISGTAQDPGTVVSGLAKVEVRIRRDSDGSYWTGSAWGGAGDSWLTASGTSDWTYSLSAANLNDGVTYTVESRATDNAGNVESSFGSDAFTFDITPPVTPVITTDGGSGPGKDYFATVAAITLEGTYDGSDTVTVLVNGSSNGVDVFPGENKWRYTGTLASGTNLFFVEVVDAAGNMSSDSIEVVFDAPAAGYLVDHVIPSDRATQSTDGTGTISIEFKIKDPSENKCTLHTFEYTVNGGIDWMQPTNGDDSDCLSPGWRDNGGLQYSTATSFADASAYTFTFNTQHPDVTGLTSLDQEDVRVRFVANDGTYDSLEPAATENFRVDNESPTVAVSYGADTGPFRDEDTVTVVATFTDQSPIEGTPQIRIAFARDAHVAFTPMSPTESDKVWTYTMDVPPGNDGTAAITVTVTDAFGNPVGAHTGNTFVVDNTGPNVAFSYSPDRPYRAADTAVMVTATFTDVNPISASPQISIAFAGGATIAAADMTPSGDNRVWTHSLDVPAGSDGIAVVTVTGSDVAGNPVGAHTGNTFVVDNTAPTVSFSYSPDRPYTDGDTAVMVTATFTDVHPISGSPQISIAFAGGAGIAVAQMTPTADNRVWTHSLDVPAGNDGIAVVTVTGSDAAGNPIGAHTGNTFVVDNTRPTVSFSYSPDRPYREADTAVTVTATFADVHPISASPQISIAFAGGAAITVAQMTPTADNRVWTHSLDVPAGNDGLAVITVTGSDAAGNPVGAHTGNTFVVDNTRPTVSFSYSPDRPYRDTDTAVIVTATFTDVHPITPSPQISIAFAAGATVTAADMTPSGDIRIWTHSLDVPPGNDGIAVVTVTGTDAAGNPVGAHTGNTFVVDNTGPTVAISYSPDRPYKDGDTSVIVTATFTDVHPITPSPQISVAFAGGAAIAAADMTPTADNKVWTHSLDVPAGNDGTAVITVTGTDAAGNPVGAHTGNTFVVDNTGPTVAISYSPDRPYKDGDTSVIVTATFTDVHPITPSPQISVAFAAGATVTAADMTPTADNKVWTHSLDVPPGNDGIAVVTVTGTDAAGNPVGAHTGNTFVVDNTAPGVVTIVKSVPEKEQWSSINRATVEWTPAQDPGGSGVAGYSILWDTHAATVPDATMDIGPVSRITGDVLPDGQDHYFHIRAVDAAGNPGETTHYGPFFISTRFHITVTDIYDGDSTALVTSDTMPYTLTLAGHGREGHRDYVWSLTPGDPSRHGTVSSDRGTTVVYTAPPSTGPHTMVSDAVTLTTAEPGTGLSFTTTIRVYNPVRVVDPTGTLGMTTTGKASTFSITAQGGSGTYSYSTSDPDHLGVNADGVLTAKTKGRYTVTVWDPLPGHGKEDREDGFRETAQVVAVEELRVSPETSDIQAGETQGYSVTGGTDARAFWTLEPPEAGTLYMLNGVTPLPAGRTHASCLFKASTAVSDNTAYTITARDGTYGTTVFAAATGTVYPALRITNSPPDYDGADPDTWPIIGYDATTTLVAEGGTGTCDWQITGPNGTASVHTILAGTNILKTDASTFRQWVADYGAGVYTISVSDPDSLGKSVVLKVKAPVYLSYEGVERQLLSLTSLSAPQRFTLVGVPPGRPFTCAWSLVNQAGSPIDSPGFGGIDPMESSAGVQSQFIPDPAYQGTPVTFRVRAQVDTETLRSLGIHTAHSVFLGLIAMIQPQGSVVDHDGAPLNGVTIRSDASAYTTTTAHGGSFAYTLLARTGAVYRLTFSKEGYVSTVRNYSGFESLHDVVLPAVTAATFDLVTGMCRSYTGTNLEGVVITLKNPDYPTTAVSDASGWYTVAVDNRAQPYAFTATKRGFRTVEFSSTAGRKDLTLVRQTGLVTRTFGDPANDEVQIGVSALPAFDGSPNEIVVEPGPPINTLAAPEAGVYTITHAPYGGFTLTIKGDTTEDKDATTGYYASTTVSFTALSGGAGLTTTTETRSVVLGVALSFASSDPSSASSFTIPPDGLQGENIPATVEGTIDEYEGLVSTALTGKVVDIRVMDDLGRSLGDPGDPEDPLKRLFITLEYGPPITREGLETGAWMVYSAPTVEDLLAGRVVPVPGPYVVDANTVTFSVEHLSAFGLGAVLSAWTAIAAGGGGGGGCFIGSASVGVKRLGTLLVLFVFVILPAMWRFSRRARKKMEGTPLEEIRS